MAPFGTIYSITEMPHARVAKSLAVAKLNNLEVNLDPDFKLHVTNKTPEYLAKFPAGKIPAFETPSGFCLSESTAIAEYIASSGPAKAQLLGRTIEEAAVIRMWTCLGDEEIFACVRPILGYVIGNNNYVHPPTYILADKYKQLHRNMRIVEQELAKDSKVWLVRDDEFSIADLSIASVLYWAFEYMLDEEARAQYPRIMDWWERLMAIPAVKEAYQAPTPFLKEKSEAVEEIEKEAQK